MNKKAYGKKSAGLNFFSLAKYPLSKRISIRIIDYALYCLILMLGKTVRFDISERTDHDHAGWGMMEQFTTDKALCIAAFWHDRILLATYFWRFSNFAAMVSESFDGEYIARIAQRLGHGIVRGSSTRGGTKALRSMIRLLKNEQYSLTLTIDGPKGPRYKVKPGAILLAKMTGVPIVPILVEPKKLWRLNSWDKLQIPRPFTKARIFVSEPIWVPENSNTDELKTLEQELQVKLDELVARGKQWRKGKN